MGSTCLGTLPSRLGAAITTTSVVSRPIQLSGRIRELAGRLVCGQEGVCCRVHGKGCPNQGGGCVTSSEPYDCDAGFANWMAGWSVPKKAWCCANKGKGCPPAAGGCA